MTLRARTLTTFRTDDEASNRFQEHVKEVLNPVLKSLAASLTWIQVGDPGAPSFVAGWTNYGGGFLPVGYTKDLFGFVHLRGLASLPGGSGGVGNSVIFALPAGFRPAAEARFTSAGEGAPSLHTILDVAADGRVVCVLPVAVNGLRSLDGMTFEAAP